MVIAGSDRTTRRRSVRRQEAPSFARYGAELRQAREQLNLSLTVVQDRTGVHNRDLEALEEGDLTRFRDERAALVAVRRYADTVGLDAAPMSQAVVDQWRSVTEAPPSAMTGPAAATPRNGPVLAPAPAPTPVAPPVIRPLADSSHLRAFTQTAQVPRVAGAPAVRPTLPPGLRFDSTDAIPVTTRPADHGRRPASMGIRVTVWTLVLLLVVGVAGLSIDHWRPGWLAKLHLVASAPPSTAASHPGGASARPPVINSSPTGPRATNVIVHSPAFQVVVATQQPCWINVTDPSSKIPVFSTTVPAGTTKIFTSVNGHLSVELGASRVLVAVQILGKTVPGWLLAPSSVPYTVTFRSATG
ncbi:MAG TPA: helix-turn-helix domain-containing protein [Acidimicrobiales bacterium]|nr:helix-turn-helix domain-containing protein [Acidimicrobiales bacterium]